MKWSRGSAVFSKRPASPSKCGDARETKLTPPADNCAGRGKRSQVARPESPPSLTQSDHFPEEVPGLSGRVCKGRGDRRSHWSARPYLDSIARSHSYQTFSAWSCSLVLRRACHPKSSTIRRIGSP